MLTTYRVEVDEDGEPGVLGAASVVEWRDPHEAQTSSCQHGGVLRQVPVPVDHVLLEQEDRQHQRGVCGDGIDAGLEVGELDHVVLQGDIGVAGEVGESLDADHVDDQVKSGEVLQRVPDLSEEMHAGVAGDVGGVKLVQPEDGHRQDKDDAEQQPVVRVNGQAPCPAVLEVRAAVRVVCGRTVQQECLDNTCKLKRQYDRISDIRLDSKNK